MAGELHPPHPGGGSTAGKRWPQIKLHLHVASLWAPVTCSRDTTSEFPLPNSRDRAQWEGMGGHLLCSNETLD